MDEQIESWFKFRGDGQPRDWEVPDPPPWRQFQRPADNPRNRRGKNFIPPPGALKLINAALYLRRPLLVTGKPGTGKTSLAYALKEELGLELLRWNIGTRSVLKDALYRYDAIARVQDEKKSPKDIGKYMRLGPLGSAIASQPHKPRVLLVDEIDKSDIDLPNDLLHVLEEGCFEIPELKRIEELKGEEVEIETELGENAKIVNGNVVCGEFPIVIMTSNGERDFPPAFLRRCLRLTMEEPSPEKLLRIVTGYLAENPDQDFEAAQEEVNAKYSAVIQEFVDQRKKKSLATDQLLNAVYLIAKGKIDTKQDLETLKRELLDHLFQSLDAS